MLKIELKHNWILAKESELLKGRNMQCQLCGQICNSTEICGFTVDESSNVYSAGFDYRIILCDSCINGIAVHSEIYRILESKVSNLRTALEDLAM